MNKNEKLASSVVPLSLSLSLSLSLQMDIHNLSNLEIENYQPASSSKEEGRRNWLALPADVISLVFLKLGAVNILTTAQWVCTSWWKLSKQPHLFHSIHVDEVFNLFGRQICLLFHLKLSREMIREAIDRSCGQLVEFFVRTMADDELLHYMSDKSSSLRCLRLRNDEDYVTEHGLIEIAKKLPQLEELEIIHFSCFSKNVFETFGRFCPQLKSFRLINLSSDLASTESDGVALAIADNMSELRHLNLFANRLTDDDLRALLDGCLHLESLHLRLCHNLEFAGDLEERCVNIKGFKHPNKLLDSDIDDVYLWCNYFSSRDWKDQPDRVIDDECCELYED